MERKRTGELLLKAAARHPYIYVALCYFVVVVLSLCVSDLLVVPGLLGIFRAGWAFGGDNFFVGFEVLIAWCIYAAVACFFSMLVFWITARTWIVFIRAKHIAVSVLPGVFAAVFIFRRYLVVALDDTYVSYSGLRVAMFVAVGAALGGIMFCHLDSE